jgi:hypothetical protein
VAPQNVIDYLMLLLVGELPTLKFFKDICINFHVDKLDLREGVLMNLTLHWLSDVVGGLIGTRYLLTNEPVLGVVVISEGNQRVSLLVRPPERLEVWSLPED